jgi:hypothetical protein
MKEMADTWAGAGGDAKTSYLATFDALVSTTEVLFFAAFMVPLRRYDSARRKSATGRSGARHRSRSRVSAALALKVADG